MASFKRLAGALTLALVVAGALATAPSAGMAGAASKRGNGGRTATFRFYGSGYGHGVGMGAYGVWGLALGDWSAGGILHHFYPHTRIQRGRLPSYVRVGLVRGATTIPVKAVGGKVQLRVGNPNTGAVAATIPSDETYTVVVRSGRYWIRRPGGSYVSGRGWGSTTRKLYARFTPFGSMIYLSQRGHTFNRGFLEFNLYRPCSGCSLRERAILQLGTESYVQGVGEEPSTRPMTMLKVFAIAARTYITYKVAAVGQHRAGCNCGIWYVGEQYYAGYRGPADRWVQAVRNTAGSIVTYGGRAIVAAYSASDGGYSASSAEEWGWSVPYLRARCDPGDYMSANVNRVWVVSMSQSNLSARIGRYFRRGIGTVRSIAVLGRSAAERITSVRISGSRGSFRASGPSFAAALGLRSDLVYVNSNRLITGAVRAKYDRLMCAPGLPLTGVLSPAGGKMQKFQHGNIYVDLVHGGSVWLRGLVLTRYAAEGGPSGELGWPKTGIAVKGSYRSATFAHGTITCSAATNTCRVKLS